MNTLITLCLDRKWSSLQWQLQSKRALQSPLKSRVGASAAKPPEGMAYTSAHLWAVSPTPEISACPFTAKEAVLELSVCPFMAKEAISECSFYPVMAAVNLCALYYTPV